MVSEPAIVAKGLLPAIDRRQSVDKFVLDGRNFLLDAEGPFSAFGSDVPTAAKLFDWSDAKTVTIERNVTFILTNSAVFQQDKTSQRIYPVFLFLPTVEQFPWSCAVVGGLYYFVKKGVDVLQYNSFTNCWKELTSVNTIGLPSIPYALVASGGRLFILADSILSWSGIDDGELYEDIPNGAGSQSLAIIGNGIPLGVYHTELGVISYTTEGAMFSRRVEAPNPYRHRPFTEHFTPISPYCIIEIADGLHIFLDQTGLFQNNGQTISPWQPLMGEFLHRTVLQTFNTSIENNPQIRLFFNRNRNWIFISIANPSAPDVYKFAYVLYVPRSEWGIFNHDHVLLDELLLESGIDIGFNFGYFDTKGFYHRFNDVNQNQNLPEPDTNIYFQSSFQLPNMTCLITSTVSTVFGDIVEATVYDRNSLVNSGIYDTSLAIIEPIFGTIDAFVDIGMFRLLDPTTNDRFSRFSGLTIGFAETIPIEAEDWLLQFVPDIEEDWNVLTGEEDWSEGISSGILFDLLIIGTVDAKNALENKNETPVLVLGSPEANYYTSDIQGIWHFLRIDARKDEQSFHIKYLEPNLIPGGTI